MKWVVIASYSYPYQAQIAKARLVSVGIPVYIENEHTVNMYWLYSNALGGVRIAVPDDRVEDAKYLIEQDFSQDIDEQFDQPTLKCPYCQSSSVEPYTEGKRSAFFFFAVVGFPLFKYKHGYKCNHCQKFFQIEE